MPNKLFFWKSMAALFLAASAFAVLPPAATTQPSTRAATRPGPGELSMGLILKDDFDADLSNWVVELENDRGTVCIRDGRLDIDAPGGCTVWLRSKLTDPVVIEYEATVVDWGGPNDRVSDLNCFWMASHPRNPADLFQSKPPRGGKFVEYDSLRTYYVGYGANDNTTTRFRRYVGDGTKPLLPEHDLRGPETLIEPNRVMRIALVADGGRIEYWRDGERIFRLEDAAPYRQGWFAIRTVHSHLLIDKVRVSRPRQAKVREEGQSGGSHIVARKTQ